MSRRKRLAWKMRNGTSIVFVGSADAESYRSALTELERQRLAKQAAAWGARFERAAVILGLDENSRPLVPRREDLN